MGSASDRAARARRSRAAARAVAPILSDVTRPFAGSGAVAGDTACAAAIDDATDAVAARRGSRTARTKEKSRSSRRLDSWLLLSC